MLVPMAGSAVAAALDACAAALCSARELLGWSALLASALVAASPPFRCPLRSQDFRLACLSQDTAAQLESLERCKALPAFGAEHFAMAAAVARGCSSGTDASTAGCPGGMEVCRAAEAARLQRLTQQAPMDYGAVAAVSTAATAECSWLGCCLGRWIAAGHGLFTYIRVTGAAI